MIDGKNSSEFYKVQVVGNAGGSRGPGFFDHCQLLAPEGRRPVWIQGLTLPQTD